MLQKIKDIVFKKFDAEEKKGVFLSGFNKDKQLLYSQGVVQTDNSLSEVLESIYNDYAKPKLKTTEYIAVDVVSEVIELEDPNEVWKMDPQEYGLIAVDFDDNRTGVLLPDTSGVADMKGALYAVKEKYGIHGKIDVAVFRTVRTLITK